MYIYMYIYIYIYTIIPIFNISKLGTNSKFSAITIAPASPIRLTPTKNIIIFT